MRVRIHSMRTRTRWIEPTVQEAAHWFERPDGPYLAAADFNHSHVVSLTDVAREANLDKRVGMHSNEPVHGVGDGRLVCPDYGVRWVSQLRGTLFLCRGMASRHTGSHIPLKNNIYTCASRFKGNDETRLPIERNNVDQSLGGHAT